VAVALQQSPAAGLVDLLLPYEPGAAGGAWRMRFRALLVFLAVMAQAGASAAEPTLPRQRPLTEARFEASADRVERGRYLAEHLLQCFICHSERDWSQPGAPPVPSRKGAGAILSESGERRIVAPNITPDIDTGAGTWTDDMLARAIREGIGHDGRGLYWGMWYQSFANLSDEDVASVVVYLRTLPAVPNALPATVLPADEMLENAAYPKPLTDPVAGPPRGDRLALGRYLIKLADCEGCHTSWYSPRNPGVFAGGNLIQRGSRSAYSSNITPNASGTGYPTDTFIIVMRSGKGGSLSPVMPWIVFRGLTDDDLRAIHEALGRVQSVSHYIGNVGVSRYCAVCGQRHPFGEFNRVETPVGVPVEPERLDRLVGRFHSAAADTTRTIRREGRHLYGREDDGVEIELIAQSDTQFLAPGWLAPIEFAVGEDGRADRLNSMELEPVPFDRLP
jgi:mono/diheme cytochrome c family protein